MRYSRLIILILIIASGCKTASISTSKVEHSEDLTIHRPNMEVDGAESNKQNTVVVNSNYNNRYTTRISSSINTEIDSLNKVIISENEQKNYFDGYTIQIYSGTSRNNAEEARAKARNLYPEMDSFLSYYQPTFRVKIGKFFDRLEATRIFNEVKTQFPKAILLPDQLRLKQSEND